MEKYLEGLNKNQMEAVLYTEGPSLVIAGAGSGKTRVLTCKIAHLLSCGYMPWNILALTFTNKAAREMRERIGRQVGEKKARSLWMGTFHSVFLRILRLECQAIGFSSHFTIYDATDSKNLIRTIIKELKLDEKVYKDSTVQNRISMAKNQLMTPQAYLKNPDCYLADCESKLGELGKIYSIYNTRLTRADAMDFDDLLLYTYQLFDEHPEILQTYQQQFGFILVDEYQDTNYAQHCIVKQLAGLHQRVCVVGDDAQSIYSFRGANVDNILTFRKTFQNSKLFKLEQNYRSTQTIVSAANSLIKKNHRQIDKDVFSEKEAGKKIRITEAYSDVEEGEIVSKSIRQLMRSEQLQYSDFAVLYRTNAQSRVFEEVFRKYAIPYRIYGGLSFYQRKEIKDVIAYFRLTENPHDEESFKRVINYPARGIGNTTLSKISQCAIEHEVSLWTVIGSPSTYGLEVNNGVMQKLHKFRSLITSFSAEIPNKTAYQLADYILQSTNILGELIADNTPESISRRDNIEELLNGINDFTQQRIEEGDSRISLTDYLSDVSLLTDQDADDGGDNQKITLMTIHSAKGLEFPAVYIVGMEENLFPSPMSLNSMRDLEEERRLFYAAITRAARCVNLSYARSRFRYGKMEFSSPSRFLKDIDEQYVEWYRGGGSFSHVEHSWKSRGVDSSDSNRQAYRPQGIFSSSSRKEDISKTFGAGILRPSAPSGRSTETSRMRSPGSSFRRVSVATSSGTTIGKTAVPKLVVGTLIEHERFGIGEVKAVEGTDDNAKATIEFRHAGVKQLLLRFARFKVIG